VNDLKLDIGCATTFFLQIFVKSFSTHAVSQALVTFLFLYSLMVNKVGYIYLP